MRLEAVPSSVSGGIVYRESFEGPQHAWSPTKGITPRIDDTEAHEGTRSLLLTGSQRGAWNYAAHTLKQAVLPGSRYRLSCWIKIDQLQPLDMPPYLKIGLTDADDQWIENVHTAVVNVQRMGEWQQLQAIVETPLNAAGGHLALERGGKDEESRVVIWLDDVALELLEAP